MSLKAKAGGIGALALVISLAIGCSQDSNLFSSLAGGDPQTAYTVADSYFNNAQWQAAINAYTTGINTQIVNGQRLSAHALKNRAFARIHSSGITNTIAVLDKFINKGDQDGRFKEIAREM